MKILNTNLPLYITIGVLALLVIILIIVFACKSSKSKKVLDKIEDQKIVVKDNVRYNAEDDKVSDLKFNEHDILLKQNEVYTVSKNGPILPGKYIMVSALEDYQKINVRTQGFVREHISGEEIVLAEGEEISPVSCNIVLK